MEKNFLEFLQILLPDQHQKFIITLKIRYFGHVSAINLL